MNSTCWAICACLTTFASGACGGKDFGANAGDSGAGGKPTQAGGSTSSSGRAGATGGGGKAQGGSVPQSAAGEPSDTFAGAAGTPDAAGAAGEPGVSVGCDPTTPFGKPGLVMGGVNSSADELSPRLSKDELTIYIARRPVNDIAQPTDLYAATRPSLDAPFIDAVKLPISTDQSDADPMLTSDGRTLFFSSDRPNGLGELDLYQSSAAAGLPFVTASRVPDVNSPGSEVQPFASSDGELWFAYRKPGPTSALHLRRAPRNGAGYGAPERVEELDSTTEDTWPLLSSDKRTIYYSSLRADGGALGKADIWRAQRHDPSAAFDPPSDVSELNSDSTDYAGWLSEDNCRLYLSSNRNATGSYQIYVAER